MNERKYRLVYRIPIPEHEIERVRQNEAIQYLKAFFERPAFQLIQPDDSAGKTVPPQAPADPPTTPR